MNTNKSDESGRVSTELWLQRHSGWIAVGVLCLAGAAQAAPGCDRGCLENQVNQYLRHLVMHDPAGLQLDTSAEVRENTVAVKLGEGPSWSKIAVVRARQIYSDPSTGNVVARTAVQMTDGNIGSLSVRLAINGRRIREVDTSFNQGTGPFDKDNLLEPDLLMDATVPAERRTDRRRMIQLVDGYFDGISRHDANIPVFAKRCDRYESGKKMTNDFTNKSNESDAVTCGESLLHLTGQEVVQRRFPLIDEERGVVLGYGFILHNERTPPTATGLAEVFKIVDGKILRIENVETIVPSPPDGGFTQQTHNSAAP